MRTKLEAELEYDLEEEVELKPLGIDRESGQAWFAELAKEQPKCAPATKRTLEGDVPPGLGYVIVIGVLPVFPDCPGLVKRVTVTGWLTKGHFESFRVSFGDRKLPLGSLWGKLGEDGRMHFALDRRICIPLLKGATWSFIGNTSRKHIWGSVKVTIYVQKCCGESSVEELC